MRILSLLYRRLWVERPPLPLAVRILASFAALNLLLFVPLYLVGALENDFWPFFPLGHPRGDYDWSWSGLPRSTYEYVMQLFVRRHNKDVFRVSAEWVFLFSSLIVVSRFGVLTRALAVPVAWCAYLVLLAFLAYSALIENLFGRPGAILDDVLLIESAVIFALDTWGWREILITAAVVGTVVFFARLVARQLNQAWRWGATLAPRRVVMAWVLLNAYSVASLAWFGVERDDPIIQLHAKRVYYNGQRSRNVLATVEALNTFSVQAANRLAETTPVRRPDILLLEVESYGATFWADDDYAAARRGLMRRVRDELDDLGLPMFSRFATAPVYGGGSWMSKASALSGLRIEAHSTYLAWRQLASRYPHLIAYLNRHGYYTLAVQPASFWNAGTYDYDDVIVRDDFAWDGPFYGFGHIPDQWSLDYAFTNYWSQHRPPRLLHFSAVSTHFAWEPPPRIAEDVADLEAQQPSFLETRPDYVELALTVPQGQKRDYFVTLAYEWELMLDVFRNRVDPGFIALIFGDHQPPFIAQGRGGFDVAVHLVTDIPDLADALPPAGFAVGGDIPWTSAAESFRVEALYPLVVTLLSTEEGAALEYSPTGLTLPIVPTW